MDGMRCTLVVDDLERRHYARMSDFNCRLGGAVVIGSSALCVLGAGALYGFCGYGDDTFFWC